MTARAKLSSVAGALLIGAAISPTAGWSELSPQIKNALTNSSLIYIATTRKSGSFGTRSESWFLYHHGAVYIAARKDSWRARRIRARRPRANIRVGTPDGPSFVATGAIVNEPAIHEIMFRTYAKKYPATDKLELMWPDHKEEYRKALKDGSRVLIKYTPSD